MKTKNQNGFFHIIAYLFIFIIFVLTVYVCLDVLNLIEVPEEYSVLHWISERSKEMTLEEGEGVLENTYRKVRIEVENAIDSSENSHFDMTQIGNYQSS